MDEYEPATAPKKEMFNKEIQFECNLCGFVNIAIPDTSKVPGPLCKKCNSSTRFRLVGYAFSKFVLSSTGFLPDAFDADVTVNGVGLSDAPPMAKSFERITGYTNTFLHKDPKLDIMSPPKNYTELDYIISSDVFEHTAPPVETPFRESYRILKRGGKLLLSVPTQEDYIEHFPSLNDYKIIASDSGYLLANATGKGKLEVFKNLRFHGGPGSTLEMRIYSRAKVEMLLSDAGFQKTTIVAPNLPKYGIFPIKSLSTVWVVEK